MQWKFTYRFSLDLPRGFFAFCSLLFVLVGAGVVATVEAVGCA
jgi:hypothetical protein